MKKHANLLLLILLFSFSVLHSQETAPVFTHEMTPGEELRRHEIGRDFTPTDPPAPPVRIVAEFEEMQSVLIRYPFGIPMALIKEMAEDCKVKTIVANSSQQQTVLDQYEAAGVNTANCEWLIAPSDSYWTRDYGPWFVVDNNYEVGISDFPYNRPSRPNDDNIPVVLAQQMGIPLYGMDLIHTGGNWMDDGLGIGASTELVWEENPEMTHQEIDTMVKDYLGIRKYHVITDPLGEYIKHIDCWGKFLDVDKVLIGEVPVSDYRYQDFEFVANYFSLQTSSWGTPYQVYRVYTPGTYPYTPYTNSLILNKKVFVPVTGSQWDDEALQVYEEAMPGYEIIGIPHNTWENTDALHCRAKGIADVDMLYVYHMPLLGNQDFQFEWDLSADIIPYSGMGILSDSTNCFYKINDGGYQPVPLIQTSMNHYQATLPFALPGSMVSYYLRTADFSGRKKNHPYIGAPDPHVFTVGYADDAIIEPDTLVFLTVEEMFNGKSFDIYNFTDGELVINDIEQEGFGYFHWYIDPWNLELPHSMAFTDTLTLNVKIDIPVEPYLGYLVTDTLDIVTENGLHEVIIKVDSDLLSSLTEPIVPASESRIGSISPNPFSSYTRIAFSLDNSAKTSLVVYNIQGQVIKILTNREFSAGNHELNWDGKDESGSEVSSGIYLLKLETERGVDFRKLILSE
jgi:agmatine/peptidylarginine deiminase